MKHAIAIVGVTLLSSCAGMQAQWQAQQAAYAEEHRAGQPTTMEALCKSLTQSYCGHCGQPSTTCSDTYVACLKGKSPASPSGLSAGQVDQCTAEVSRGDCAVMGQATWPAACYPPESPSTPVVAAPAAPEPAAPVAAAGPPPTKPGARPNCKALVIEKGYGPSAAPQCQGAEAYCAEAVLDKGFGPSSLSNCRGVDGPCAVAVIQKGYGPSSVPECRGVDRACALAALEKGYGPSSLANCKRRH